MDFKFGLDELEKLLRDKKLEVQDGVFVCADEGVCKPTLFVGDDGFLHVEFEAPFMYLHVTKLGPKKLANLVKPRVLKIVFKKDTILVSLSSLGDWEFDR